ncbi:DUF485 domain-containing protein [Corynebacterium ulceribovis]|uniref:DUF485 domain-containing protein n=1 Tax=Corynebacterium ulceribovis TaxID=487732 RepID=UPI0003751DD5|nr:DUF485 domain-containing protein [Corynebacterium ulceribovis]
MSNPNPQVAGKRIPTPQEYMEVQKSPEFSKLRSTFLGFTVPLTVLGLAWFMVYVLLAVYAPSFMGKELPVVGNIGFLIGILQFVTTFFITYLYIQFANKKLSPMQGEIAQKLEG